MTIKEMISEIISDCVVKYMPENSYIDKWNDKELEKRCLYIFGISLPIKVWMEEEGIANEEIKLRIHDQVKQRYEQKTNQYGLEMMRVAEKRVMLNQIDMDWRNHLQAMDNLKSSVGLRSMAGKDPYNEYKMESFNYFDEMLTNQNEKVVKTLFNIEIISHKRDEESRIIQDTVKKPDKNMLHKKIQRNEPCPCGSGKKYKNCHGK